MLGLLFKCATQTKPRRIIYFTGHSQINDTNGCNKMITRVYGDCGTISGLLYDSSQGWLSLECASRTLSNLYNLHTCRGCITKSTGADEIEKHSVLDLSASMSGPHHYLGHIDPRDHVMVHIPQTSMDGKSYKYGLPTYTSYTINTGDNHKLIQPSYLDLPTHKPKSRIPGEIIYTLPVEKWKWISGKDMTSILKKRYNVSISDDKYYKDKYINTATGTLATDSLFPNPGILELGVSEIQLRIINPDPDTNDGVEYDFAEFGAQLVRNSQPWQFRQSGIQANPHAQHKLRLITYYYGARYVDDYLMKPRKTADRINGCGSGLFIERHEFIQAITPINSDCYGFVILGRELKTWTGRIVGLELIGVQVPFGWTLLVEPWAIHGNSNLVGLYSMAMTGNHEAMQTVDTVFLKNHNNGANVKVVAIPSTYKSTKFPDGLQKLLINSNQLSPEELLAEDTKLKEEIRAGCSWMESWYYNPVIFGIHDLGKKNQANFANTVHTKF